MHSKDGENQILKKPLVGRRQPISVTDQSLIRISEPEAGRSLPVVIQPDFEGIDLIAWASKQRELIEEHLRRSGAILFRHFEIGSAEEFERFVGTMSGALLEYRERSSPRQRIFGRIYTSTDYPADQSIFPHNENSYASAWPLKIFFFCETPAESGGETPLADVRKVLRRIPSKIRERFAAEGWMHVRNFGAGLGLDWQTVFQTRDKQEVERYCREAGIIYEWRSSDRLRIRRIMPAITRHPQTGEDVWFNHIAFFHVSTLDEAIRKTIQAEFEEQDLPNNTYYGDGSKIEVEVMEILREAYKQELVEFSWKKGDLLMVDNMLTAHARAPFAGQRKILVAMAEPFKEGE
jgi:alpha-ketoglutarate-dependent taurine dioxygenase